MVRGYTALRQLAADPETSPATHAFRYVVGVRLVFADGTPDIIAYPTDRAAYGRLCRLLTIGNTRDVDGRRAEKGAYSPTAITRRSSRRRCRRATRSPMC